MQPAAIGGTGRIPGAAGSPVPVDEIVAPELLLPVAVGVDLVRQHRALLAAMAGQVALPVAVEIVPARHPGPVDRVLPDAGEDYRTAHSIAVGNDNGMASEPDLRLAMFHYHSLLKTLLEDDGPGRLAESPR
jgi:hypothetical protein